MHQSFTFWADHSKSQDHGRKRKDRGFRSSIPDMRFFPFLKTLVDYFMLIDGPLLMS